MSALLIVMKLFVFDVVTQPPPVPTCTDQTCANHRVSCQRGYGKQRPAAGETDRTRKYDAAHHISHHARLVDTHK